MRLYIVILNQRNIIYDENTGKTTIIDYEGRYTETYYSPEQIKDLEVSLKDRYLEFWYHIILSYIWKTSF